MSEKTAVETVEGDDESMVLICETLVPILDNESLVMRVAGTVNLHSMLTICTQNGWDLADMTIAFISSEDEFATQLQKKTVETRDAIDIATIMEAVADNKFLVGKACIGVVFLSTSNGEDEDDEEYVLALFEQSIN